MATAKTLMEFKTSAIPKFGLCLDWETTGADWGVEPSRQADSWQGVSFGAVIFDFETLLPVKTLYREVKYTPKGYDGKQNWGWSKGAQDIHGLTIEYLEENGVSQQEAAMDLAELQLEYLGPDSLVPFLGHNREFDIAFTRQLYASIGLPFKLHHVTMDTSGLGMLTLGIYRSKDLFSFVGLNDRKEHNALEDALFTLESTRRIRGMVNAGLGIE